MDGLEDSYDDDDEYIVPVKRAKAQYFTPEKQKIHDEIDEFPSYAMLMTPPSIENEKSLMKKKEKLNYSKGELVWAKYKKYSFWPAVVSGVNPKKKKVTVIFLPKVFFPIQRNKSELISISASQVKPYEENRDENKIQSSDAKRSDDINSEFFVAKSQAEKIFNLKINPFEHTLPVLETFFEEAKNEEREDVVDLEDEENTSNNCPSVCDSFKFSEETERKIKERKDKNIKLMNYFYSNDAKIHLKKLINEELETSRTISFREKVPTRRLVTNMEHKYGPIIDEDQVECAFKILVDQYRNEKTEEQSIEFILHFVREILLPEAVKFALMNVFGFNENEAEDSINRTHSFTEEEMKIINQEFL